MIFPGYVTRADNKITENSNNTGQRLQPIIKEKLDTGQELRIYKVTINYDVCYNGYILKRKTI